METTVLNLHYVIYIIGSMSLLISNGRPWPSSSENLWIFIFLSFTSSLPSPRYMCFYSQTYHKIPISPCSTARLPRCMVVHPWSQCLGVMESFTSMFDTGHLRLAATLCGKITVSCLLAHFVAQEFLFSLYHLPPSILRLCLNVHMHCNMVKFTNQALSWYGIQPALLYYATAKKFWVESTSSVAQLSQ